MKMYSKVSETHVAMFQEGLMESNVMQDRRQ